MTRFGFIFGRNHTKTSRYCDDSKTVFFFLLASLRGFFHKFCKNTPHYRQHSPSIKTWDIICVFVMNQEKMCTLLKPATLNANETLKVENCNDRSLNPPSSLKNARSNITQVASAFGCSTNVRLMNTSGDLKRRRP